MKVAPKRIVHLFFNRYFIFLILAGGTLCWSSCRHKTDNTESSITDIFVPDKFDEDDFADALKEHYGEGQISDSNWNKGKIATVGQMMQFTYQSAEYLPLWVTEDGNTDVAEALLKDLESLKDDGINTQRYHTDSIPTIIARLKGKDDISIGQVLAIDTLCTRAYLQASKDLLLGMINPKRADSLWFHVNDTLWRPDSLLITSLHENRKYPGLDSFRSKIHTYTLLRREMGRYRQLAADSFFRSRKATLAVTNSPSDSQCLAIIRAELPGQDQQVPDTLEERKALFLAYQAHFRLKPTGKADPMTLGYLSRQPDSVIDIIRANLERVRWMPRQLETDYVLVNIPMMELMLYHNGTEAMHMNVIVGKNARQTPALNAKMVNVVVNPPWGVPPTIMKKDVLPGMQKSGKKYLDKKGLAVYDFKGNRVDASQVNASNYKKFVFRQAPGDDNALGYVKFNLPNIWNIYLHDTPHRGDFNNYDRALSSGCIRLQYPREMAEYVLKEMNDKDFDQPKLDSLIKTQKTRYETLRNRPMVHIVYLTAFEDDTKSNIRFLRDFYKRDAKLIALLQQG